MAMRLDSMQPSDPAAQARGCWPQGARIDGAPVCLRACADATQVGDAPASRPFCAIMPDRPPQSDLRRVRNAPLGLIRESELQGACRGWDGSTVFKLVNGEIWQQSSFRIRLLYLNCPAVRVWRLGDYHWLELEGAGEILPVKYIGHSSLIASPNTYVFPLELPLSM